MSPSTRRAFMMGAGTAAGALVVGTAGITLKIDEARASGVHLAQAKYDHHLAGLKAAARELNPSITAWAVAGAPRGNGARFLLVGTCDQYLTYGESIGGCMPINHFVHDRLGQVPDHPWPSYRTADERYAGMTARENLYRQWLGMEVRS